MDEKKYDFNQGKYNGDYLSNVNQDMKTTQKIDAIEKLFEEWNEDSFDDGDLTYKTEFQNSTPNEYFYNDLLNNSKKDVSSGYMVNTDDDLTVLNDNSSNTSKSDDYSEDFMNQTKEIDSVSLEELKAIQADLHRLYNDSIEDDILENEGVSQSKGKKLVKATKQGMAFSNGSLTRTFLDCAVLCFVTASMGFMFLMNIINHI